MLYKVILSIFLISTMTLIMCMIFTIKISNQEYKIETIMLMLRRYLEAEASAVVTTHRPSVTRNETFYQKGITRIVSDLKREFSSIGFADFYIYIF